MVNSLFVVSVMSRVKQILGLSKNVNCVMDSFVCFVVALALAQRMGCVMRVVKLECAIEERWREREDKKKQYRL